MRYDSDLIKNENRSEIIFSPFWFFYGIPCVLPSSEPVPIGQLAPHSRVLNIKEYNYLFKYFVLKYNKILTLQERMSNGSKILS